MERLHPRVRVVWSVGALVSALFVAAIVGAVAVFAPADAAYVGWLTLPYAVGVFVVFAALGVVFAVLRYRVFRFEVREDTVFIQRGVLTRVRTVVPYVRVQHVDTQRGPLERVVGLSTVVVYTAGSRGADVSIPGLTPERAEELQSSLRELAIESEPEDAV